MEHRSSYCWMLSLTWCSPDWPSVGRFHQHLLMPASWWTSDVSSLKATQEIEQFILTVWSMGWIAAFCANERLGAFWKGGSKVYLGLPSRWRNLCILLSLSMLLYVYVPWVLHRWLGGFFNSFKIITSCGSLTCIAYQMPHKLGNILVGIRRDWCSVQLSRLSLSPKCIPW